MARSLDLVGATFGRLTVTARTDVRVARRVMWECRCECGQWTLVSTSDLREGGCRSCGCLRIDHPNRYVHGLARTPTYQSWLSMHDRCTNPSSNYWHRYGGRGITVCERWSDVAVFAADMGERPEGTSLDRIDNDGPYSPENCRWATPREQGANKSNSYYVLLNGERMILSEAARRLGVNPGGLWARLDRGTQPLGLVKA